MGHNSKCLEDIEAALMFGYPEDMQYKLMDRRGRCLLRCQRLYEAQEALEVASLLVQKSKLSAEDKLKFKQDIKDSMNQSVMPEGNEDRDEEEQCLLIDPHPCIPGLSSKVEVRYDARRGRHSLAAQEISPGEAVCVDTPVGSTVHMYTDITSFVTGYLVSVSQPQPHPLPPLLPGTDL